MINKLVSLIIPIYNVDKYLSKCIESVLAQTYSQIEVILINDGSKDTSGNIADFFAKSDSRVTVIHQRNSGVSSARNAGIDSAKGEYITFIDADDWIAPDFVEHLLKIAETTCAELVFSKCIIESDDARFVEENTSIEIWNPIKVTQNFLYADIIIGSWNKFFKKSFIDNHQIRFKNNIFMGEGLNFITDVSQRISFAAVTNKPIYFYRRDNIHSATTKISVEKIKNALVAIDTIRNNLILKDSEIINALDYHELLTGFNFLKALVTLKDSSNENIQSELEVLVHDRAKKLIHKNKFNIKKRIKILLIFVSPRMAIAFSKLKAVM